jgi:hypothetical protein
MTAAIPETAIGVFRDRKKADKAVETLVGHGFRRDHIAVNVTTKERTEGPPEDGVEDRATEAGIVGTSGGFLLGAVFGALLGLVPGLAGGLSDLLLLGLGALAGLVLGGILGHLIGKHLYRADRAGQSDSEAGRILVEVKAEGRYEEAVDVLRRCGARGRGSPLV